MVIFMKEILSMEWNMVKAFLFNLMGFLIKEIGNRATDKVMV